MAENDRLKKKKVHSVLIVCHIGHTDKISYFPFKKHETKIRVTRKAYNVGIT